MHARVASKSHRMIWDRPWSGMIWDVVVDQGGDQAANAITRDPPRMQRLSMYTPVVSRPPEFSKTPPFKCWSLMAPP